MDRIEIPNEDRKRINRMARLGTAWFVFVGVLGIGWTAFLAWAIYRIVMWLTG